MPAYVSEGVFAGLGGDVVIHIDVTPDIETIESELLQVASNLEDTYKPMLTSKRLAQEDVQEHFDSEAAPNGLQWLALNEDYLRRKEAAGDDPRILRRTGDLEAAAVSDEAYVVTPQGLFFNWDALPMTADGHNVGKLQQTDYSGIDAARTEDSSNQGRHRIGRPFVGMSDFMEQSFIKVFDIWFDEAISVVVNPRTGVMQHFEGNRFGSKVKI